MKVIRLKDDASVAESFREDHAFMLEGEEVIAYAMVAVLANGRVRRRWHTEQGIGHTALCGALHNFGTELMNE